MLGNFFSTIARVAFWCALLDVAAKKEVSSVLDPGHHYFPTDIPEYPVRVDIYTNRAVSISVLTPEDLSNVEAKTSSKIEMSSLKRHFQCAPYEPAFGDDAGAWDF